jgi:hypothetical protein
MGPQFLDAQRPHVVSQAPLAGPQLPPAVDDVGSDPVHGLARKRRRSRGFEELGRRNP